MVDNKDKWVIIYCNRHIISKKLIDDRKMILIIDDNVGGYNEDINTIFHNSHIVIGIEYGRWDILKAINPENHLLAYQLLRKWHKVIKHPSQDYMIGYIHFLNSLDYNLEYDYINSFQDYDNLLKYKFLMKKNLTYVKKKDIIHKKSLLVRIKNFLRRCFHG
jgi:hypothetical protein